MDTHLKNLALTMGVEPYSFNPYENANDDYAVLEWMRKQDFDTHQNFAEQLCTDLVNAPLNYTVGDYARAALRVLNTDASFQDGFMTKEQGD